ncbi:MAG TPA: diaminopimelate dehydrogenase [Syntrophomonadaceae bacterium]|nr:diaminopimelate dehydrogenase [Syntrophomonadaceae bacterium]HQD91125.1 diaminopimelate dehydrogenase [Syntrophomonadaceae bacterium]
MEEKIKIAIVGYGNIGRYAVETVQSAPDMELVGIVRRKESLHSKQPDELSEIKVVSSIDQLPGVQVALLCTPTRSVPELAKEILAAGINTVDSYDIHNKLADLRLELDQIAKAHKSVAVVSAGWDPGTDSIIRCMFKFMAPHGITYTNFGPGMSMGHSVAVNAIAGVEKALSMTIPLGTGIHRRMVYVQLKPGVDFKEIERAIKNDPYFINDETHVQQVEDVQQLTDMGHGVVIEHKGSSGNTHNQRMQFNMSINNPALTAQIMAASARASLKQQPGAYTLIQIPIIDFIYGNPDDIIRKYV